MNCSLHAASYGHIEWEESLGETVLILKVSSDIINTVRYLANADISKVGELTIPDDKFNEYWMFLRRYASYHLGKLNLKSESVLCKTLSKR